MTGPSSKFVGAWIAADLADAVRDQARLEHRSVSNLIEVALIERIERTAILAAEAAQGVQPGPQDEASSYIGAGRRRRRRKPVYRITSGPLSVGELLIAGGLQRQRRARAQAEAAATTDSSEG